MLGAPLFPGTDGIDGIGDGDDQPGISITPYFFTTRTANGGTAAKPRATSVQRNGGGSR